MPGGTFVFSRLEPAGLLLSLSAKNRAAYRGQRPFAGYAEAARGRPQVKVDKEPTQQASAIELARMAEAPEGRRSQSASNRFRLVESRSFSPAFSRQNATLPEGLLRAEKTVSRVSGQPCAVAESGSTAISRCRPGAIPGGGAQLAELVCTSAGSGTFCNKELCFTRATVKIRAEGPRRKCNYSLQRSVPSFSRRPSISFTCWSDSKSIVMRPLTTVSPFFAATVFRLMLMRLPTSGSKRSTKRE